jgi:hypothetical protein
MLVKGSQQWFLAQHEKCKSHKIRTTKSPNIFYAHLRAYCSPKLTWFGQRLSQTKQSLRFYSHSMACPSDARARDIMSHFEVIFGLFFKQDIRQLQHRIWPLISLHLNGSRPFPSTALRIAFRHHPLWLVRFFGEQLPL